jgi:hypothetical protein
LLQDNSDREELKIGKANALAAQPQRVFDCHANAELAGESCKNSVNGRGRLLGHQLKC